MRNFFLFELYCDFMLNSNLSTINVIKFELNALNCLQRERDKNDSLH